MANVGDGTRKGFLAGTVVLALLLALMAPRLMNRSGSRVIRTKADMAAIVTSLGAFRLDCGRYPTAGEGLEALLKAPPGLKGWSGPYIHASSLLDPWGRQYIYVPPSSAHPKSILMRTYGANGSPAGQPDGDEEEGL